MTSSQQQPKPKPSVRETTERMLMGRASAAAPIFAILIATVLRMILEAGMYSRWDIGHYPRVLAQQLTFYTYMFVSFAIILKLGLRRPFERVTNVASVGLIFSVMPPIVHAYFFSGDDRPTVYFQTFTWTLFEAKQAAAESVILWMLILSTGLFVGFLARSVVRGLLAALAGYAVIQLLSLGVLEALSIREQANSNYLFGASIGTRDRIVITVSSAQSLVATIAYVAMRGRALWPSIRRLSHALPHVALLLCGAAWSGNIGPQTCVFAGLVLLSFFVLLVQNDYFDRKEDALSGRAASVSRDDVLWVTFLFANFVVTWFVSFPWLALLLTGILLLGALYHHPAVRLKTRFCLSYMVEGGWAALAFAAGTCVHDGPVSDASLSAVVSWVFWGGALLSMIKDWKDVAADRAAGVWTMYVTLAQKWPVRRVHQGIVGAITIGLLGFAAFNALSWGVSVGVGATVLGATAFLWAALALESRRAVVEVAMFAYTLALLGVAWSFWLADAPGVVLG